MNFSSDMMPFATMSLFSYLTSWTSTSGGSSKILATVYIDQLAQFEAELRAWLLDVTLKHRMFTGLQHWDSPVCIGHMLYSLPQDLSRSNARSTSVPRRLCGRLGHWGLSKMMPTSKLEPGGMIVREL